MAAGKDRSALLLLGVSLVVVVAVLGTAVLTAQFWKPQTVPEPVAADRATIGQ